MGYFDDLITQENSKHIPIWRYLADIAEKYQSSAIATIEYLRHFDIPVYTKNGLAEYNLLEDVFPYYTFAYKLNNLHSYIDSVSNQLNIDVLEAQTKENPHLFEYLKISELPILPIPDIETNQKDNQQIELVDSDVSKTGLSDFNHQAIIDDLTYQLNQAHAKITELEQQLEQTQIGKIEIADKQTAQPIQFNFDKTNPHIYPPELDIALQIWHEIYQKDNNDLPKHFTNHSDKFDWAMRKLHIQLERDAELGRIKKITTPQKQKSKTKSKKIINSN